jgi:acetyl esterase/lipase
VSNADRLGGFAEKGCNRESGPRAGQYERRAWQTSRCPCGADRQPSGGAAQHEPFPRRLTTHRIRTLYRHLSPVSHVDPGDPPTFPAYGDDDRIVPPGQSELLGKQLQEASVIHHLVELPWANHAFDFLWGGWSLQITRYSLKAFLESYLEVQAEDVRTAPHRSQTK